MEHVWQPGPRTGPNRGRWLRPPTFCEACEARAAQHQEETERRQHDEARGLSLDNAGLPRRYRAFSLRQQEELRPGESFEAFAARLPRGTVGVTDWNRRLVAELTSWTPESGGRLVIGPVGGGKTTLIAALLHDHVLDGGSALYLPESVLWSSEVKRRAAHHRVRPTLPNLLERACEVELLALDDLGTTENLREWQLDAIEHLINVRYNEELPVLVTSNYDLSTLADLYGERVASRLAEMVGNRQIELRGRDWRTGHEHLPPPEAPDPEP